MAAHNYVDNDEFLEELLKHKREQPEQISEYLALTFMSIAEGLARTKKFATSPYKEDMIMDAVEKCICKVNKFNPEKSNKPFAYFSQVCYNSFLQTLSNENRQQRIAENYFVAHNEPINYDYPDN